MKLKCINKKFLAIIVSFLSLILCITSFGGLKTKNAKASYDPYAFGTIGMTVEQVLANQGIITAFVNGALDDFEDENSLPLNTVIVDSQFCPNFLSTYNPLSDYFLYAVYDYFVDLEQISTFAELQEELAEKNVHIFVYIPEEGYYVNITDGYGYTTSQILSRSDIQGICALSFWPMTQLYSELLYIQGSVENNSNKVLSVYVLPLEVVLLGTSGLEMIIYESSTIRLYDIQTDTWRTI